MKVRVSEERGRFPYGTQNPSSPLTLACVREAVGYQNDG